MTDLIIPNNVQIKASEYLGHWSLDLEIISVLDLEILLTRKRCQMNDPNY